MLFASASSSSPVSPCSSIADSVNGVVPHLHARDVTFLCVSRSPIDTLEAYKQRLGWQFPWVSSLGSDFNFDFGASRPREEAARFVEGGASSVLVDLAARTGTRRDTSRRGRH